MSNILKADFYHMFRTKWIWLCTLAMVSLAIAFCMIQYTALDYKVGLDRIIFLPMSFYGVAVAALIGLFVGEDYSDGIIRNKLIAGKTRKDIYLSKWIVSCCGSLFVYMITTLTSLTLGCIYFEHNVSAIVITQFINLGLLTCLAYSSIYAAISVIAGNKSVAITCCMALAFIMLFLCLRSNAVLVQQEFKDGVLNPHYITGLKRVIYEWVHDLNPSGQAAQLSEMKILKLTRFILSDCLWTIGASGLGIIIFCKKNIK